MSETTTVTLSQQLRSLADYATAARPISRLTDLGRVAVRKAADELDTKDAEIIKLTSQLEEARAENKRIIIQRDAASMSNDLLQLSHKTLSDRDIEWGKEVLELRASVEEARAKAISECIAIADAELADPKNSGRSIAKLLRSLGSTK